MKYLLTVLLALVSFLPLSAQRFQTPPSPKQPEREIRVLCIGNSFTYYHDTDAMLRDIAASQGLRIQVGKFLKGGQTFGQHLNLAKTARAIEAGGYDFALLQDQSATPARYSRDGDAEILSNLIELKNRILAASPGCRTILERTWSYAGNKTGGFASEHELDRHLRKGCKKMARKAGTWYSPIGEAFNTARAERPDIALLGPDNHHQSPEGAYLKACVNYLVITGKPFSGHVDCSGLSPAIAAYLRDVAQRTVLGSERRYRIHRSGKALPYSQGPLVVAHRGWHYDCPENTVEALAGSQQHRVFGSEFDIWLTAEDSLIVSHDRVPDCDAHKFPTFNQFLDQELRNPCVKLVCELKRHGSDSRDRQLFDTAYALVKKRNLQAMMIWQTFSFELCCYIRSVDPYARVIYLCTKEKQFRSPEELAAAGLSGANFGAAIYKAHPGLAAELHSLGLYANLCVQDKHAVWEEMIREGVDIIGTNKPAELLKINWGE